MSELERYSERLSEDERWQRDLTSADAAPLLDAGLALLAAALTVYTPADPAARPYQAAYREASAGLIREALALAARAITVPAERAPVLAHGLRPLHWALGVPGWEDYQARIDALIAAPRPLTGDALATALRPAR